MKSAGPLKPWPSITVAIPTIDRPAMLSRALGSVLDQAGDDVQVIVSDNASLTDLPAHVPALADPRVTFQRHETRLPMTENWNSCLQAATGDCFVLLSDDDALAPGGLAALGQGFRRAGGGDDTRIGLVYGRTLVTDGEDRPLWTSLRGAADEPVVDFARGLMRHKRAIYLCSTMIRTRALLSAGGYDGRRFGPAADLGASLEVAFACGRVRFVETVVSTYAEHGASATSQLDLDGWSRAIVSIGALVKQQANDTTVRAARLDRDVRSFVAYGIMDVARASSADGASLLRTWWRAERARRAAKCPVTPSASTRLLAKLVYVRVSQLRSRLRLVRRTRRRAAGQ